MTKMVDQERMSRAERILWDYGISEPRHIDLEAIALDQGVQVKYRELGGCEARLVIVGDRGIVSVDSGSNPGRQRFSLAHELAHWFCDRGRGGFLCAKDDIGPENDDAKRVESLANGFASQLILPTYLVDPWVEGKPVSLELASRLADDFRASLTAAAIKLVTRTSAPACLVCHGQTGIEWFRRSAALPDEFRIVPELHQDTDAFGLAFGQGSGMSRIKRCPASHWLLGRDAFRNEVAAQSIKLPNGPVLSTVVLEQAAPERNSRSITPRRGPR